MAMTVDGGGAAKAAKPAPAPTPEPAAAKSTEKAAPAAKPETPAAQAPADAYKAPAPKKEDPVSLTALPRAGEEIPTATKTGGDTTISATDFGGEAGAAVGAGGKDPAIDIKDNKDIKYEPVKGTPFIQGAGDSSAIHWNDVDQGGLGDCYLMSAMGSVAQQDPNVIQNAIKDNGDGTYTVRFYEKQGTGPLGIGGLFGSHEYKPVDITVSGDMPMKNGQPAFAGLPDASGDQREMWPALIEKAYAQWKGGYNAIGNGGSPAGALEAITGKPSESMSGSGVTIDQLDKMFQDGNAIVASTLPKGDKKDIFANGTLVSNHAYMVTGVDKDAGTVTLRNPWGSHLPDVKLSIEDFNKYITNVAANPG